MSINKNQEIILDRSKIKGSVIFDTLDTHRLVIPEQTVAVILLLRNYFKKNKSGYFDLNLLIPENIGVISNELKYSQYLVNRNYSLLKPYKLISYDEALFLLLGLNTEALHSGLPGNFTLFKNKPPKDSLEYSFYITLQNKELSESMFLRSDGSITSNDLNTLANNNNFFTKLDERINKRNLNKITLEKLHNILTQKGFIAGDYDNIWIWKTYRNRLAYLAKKLKMKHVITKADCHIELSYYIEDSAGPEVKKPLSDHSDKDMSPKSIKIIDEIIDEIIR
jgi:hypothetical protein